MKKRIIIAAVFTACLALYAAVWPQAETGGETPELPQTPAVSAPEGGKRGVILRLALLLRAAVIAAARALAAALPAVHDLLIRLLNFHEFLFGLRGVRLAHVRIGVIPLAERSIGLLHLVVAGRRGYA